MDQPLLNIHFCGSGIEGSRSHFASLKALSIVPNHLILSGVGAPAGFNPNTQIFYPSPGTFKVEGLQQRLKWRSSSWITVLTRAAGWLFGYGEKENLRWALALIQQKMACNSSKIVAINISGYSRGGTSALYLAHLIKELYGESVYLNLFLIDPNAGFGQHHIPFKRIIPKNVRRLYIVSSRDEAIQFFKARPFSHFKLENSQLHYVDISMAGRHLAQEKFPKNQCLYSPALMNQYLLSLFYASFAIAQLDETEIYLHVDYIKINQFQLTQPKKLIDQVITRLSG